MNSTQHTIINGDCRKMSEVADKSVHLIVTSPPYWQLKDYGSDEQIGFNDSYEQYINHLNLVWKECYRVLHDGCRLCINIGDQFARSVYYGRYKVIPIHSEIIRFCETIGFDFMGQIIWQKATTMNTSGGGAVMGSFPYPRNGILKMDYEFILLFKKLGDAPKPSAEQKKQSILTKEEWNQYFSSHWHFSGVKQSEHLAMFPEELPKRLIKMFSFVGETVFDPFLGSGTTSLAAKNLNRNSIGYEINKTFKPLIEKKLHVGEIPFDGGAEIDFSADTPPNQKFDFTSLPYLYSDPHKMDKKVDIKKLQFGSKIDLKSPKKENLYTVKHILSPEKLLLNNGTEVKLIGVKTNPQHEQAAIEFLKNKFQKRKIYLVFDKEKSGTSNQLLCYVYLDNKTFINKHLIRTGYVDVDVRSDYKYKDKFLEVAGHGEGMDLK